MMTTWRRERQAIVGIGGFFLFLPMVMLLVLLPPAPQPVAGQSLLPVLTAYFEQYKLEFIFTNIWVGFGELVVATLLTGPDRPSVGDALRRSGQLFGWYLLQRMIVLMILFGGALMFVLPAIYLAARLSLCTVVIGAGEAKTPIDVIRRSLALTHGAGLHIAILMVLIWLGSNLFAQSMSGVLAAIFAPVADWAVASLANALLQGLVSMPAMLLPVLFAVSLWRALRSPSV